MAYTQLRGKYIHAYYLKANGKYGSKSRNPDTGKRFADEDEAVEWATTQEWKERLGLGERPEDPSEEMTVNEWFVKWWTTLDVGQDTLDDYALIFRAHVLPEWGKRQLGDIKASDVNAWELRMIDAGYERGGVPRNARARLTTLLADAVAERLIDSNPALKVRGRGRRSGVRPHEDEKVWSTPLEAFLVSERGAIMSGRDDEFILFETIFWTGARWAEAAGLQREHLTPGQIAIKCQLKERKSTWRLGPPKDDSYRDIDIMPYLQNLLARQIAAHPDQRCKCKGTKVKGKIEQPCTGGAFLFLGHRGGHLRNSNTAARYWIPAADGRYVTSKSERSPEGNPVVVDADGTWPGQPLQPWPRAVRGEPYELPPWREDQSDGPPLSAPGYQRRPDQLSVNAATPRADLVAYAVTQGLSLAVAEEMTRGQILDMFIRSRYADSDTSVASWVGIKEGLTFHGNRHGTSTMLNGFGTPTRLHDDRMGHASPEMPRRSMRRRYTHVADEWRATLRSDLQEEAMRTLAMRAWFGLHSPVAVVDDLLAPFRDGRRKPVCPFAKKADVIDLASRAS